MQYKNNIKASIFIYILLLINITFIIAVTVYNNWFILNNSINIWRNSEEVFTGIFSNWDIAINSVKKYNSNWNWYLDWISCPTNVSMEWLTLSSTGIITQMVYSSWSVYCQWFYNSKEFRLYYNEDYSEIVKAYYSWSVVDIIYEDATTFEIWLENIAVWSTITWTLNEVAGWFTKIVDWDTNGIEYKSEDADVPHLDFTFSGNRSIWRIIIYNEPGLNNWNNWKIIWLSSTWAQVFETTIVDINNPSNKKIEINLKLLWLLDYVRTIRIESTDWFGRDIEISEVEIFQMVATSASLNVALSSNWTTATWTQDESSWSLDVVIDWNTWNPLYVSLDPTANPFLKLTFDQDYSLWAVRIYKKKKINEWDQWNLYWLDSVDSVVYTVPYTGVADESRVYINLLTPSYTWSVRSIKLEGTDWKIMEIYEIEGYEFSEDWWWESRRWLTNFDDPDFTWIEFDKTWIGWYDSIDDDFNSDDYKITSYSWVYYPNNFQDDDVIPRKIIFWNIPAWSVFQNIFWNNYKTNNFIENNSNNNDIINMKIWDVENWIIHLDLYNTWENKFDLKILEFDSDSYENQFTILPINKYETFDLTQYNWYIQNNSWTLSLSKNKTWNEYIFDYKNKDYWIFISNKSDWNLTYRLSSETTTWTGIYINPIDDSWTWIIEVMSNYVIIGWEKNFIWDNFIITWLK
jgi:hypothetical protein